MPTFTVAGFFGMLSAVIASTIESIGDYQACAKLAEVTRPPTHALNRQEGLLFFECLVC